MTSIGLRPALLFFSLTGVNTAASISARKLSNGTTRAIISSGSPFAEIAASRSSASKKPNCPIIPTSAKLVVTNQIRTNSRRSLFFEVPSRPKDGIVCRQAELLGDKAYDSNSFRRSLRQDGIRPVIPGRANRKKRIRHDKEAYKGRNVIERCYCRLKDFRRIATRYDKLARNYFSSVHLAALVAYWLH